MKPGAGAPPRRPDPRTVWRAGSPIYGMFASTVLMLLAIPLIYFLYEKRRRETAFSTTG